MAIAEFVTIGREVVNELNTSGRWSQPFQAERLYLPEMDLEQFTAGELHVTVLTKGITRGAASRGRAQVDHQVPVIFQQKLQPNTDDVTAPSMEDQCDPLVLLVEEIADWFDEQDGRPLANYATAWLTGITLDVVYDQASLEENRLFAMALVLNFRTWRDRR
jgi:hypothetical protein